MKRRKGSVKSQNISRKTPSKAKKIGNFSIQTLSSKWLNPHPKLCCSCRMLSNKKLNETRSKNLIKISLSYHNIIVPDFVWWSILFPYWPHHTIPNWAYYRPDSSFFSFHLFIWWWWLILIIYWFQKRVIQYFQEFYSYIMGYGQNKRRQSKFDFFWFHTKSSSNLKRISFPMDLNKFLLALKICSPEKLIFRRAKLAQ